MNGRMPDHELNVCFLINHLDTGGAQTLLRNIVELDDRSDVNYSVCYAGGESELVSTFESIGVEVHDLGARTEQTHLDPGPLIRPV